MLLGRLNLVFSIITGSLGTFFYPVFLSAV